ncbi:O-antigen ligase family protein [Cellulophaga sp. HaHa_2_95]|uniref:O-antigen ligase family protein n=1 Tax=Cellulophaga sp. HaHa_2_95 TaxID=2745558 RepID=UPI001C4F96FD|nr:O-antigen ligase family protein [Cellulophaga sp. HaHa_2_95]QXP56497.1 O-antigen ligase family protein [Cellulophaga sp. HaHa_2_95]
MDKKYLKYFLSSSSFVLIMLITLLYTDNLKQGFIKTQQSSSILIFPLIIFFFQRKITSKQFDKLLVIFNTACLLSTIYIYTEIYKNGVFSYLFEKEVSFWNNPFRDVLNNLSYLDLHPSYYSIWLLFCALFLINKLLTRNKSLSVVFSILSLVIFFIFTSFLFASRATIIGFFIAVLILLILKIKSKLNKAIAVSLIIVISLISITQISFLKVRFFDEVNAQKLRPPVGIAHTSSNIRVGIYKCASELFQKNPIVGVGIGDVQAELNNCYLQFHTRVYQEGNYNTHSTYLNLLLSGGIIGLLLFLLSIFLQLKLALKSENYLYLSFIILIIPFFLFENVLSRMHGAVFYGLFNALFIKQILSTKK